MNRHRRAPAALIALLLLASACGGSDTTTLSTYTSEAHGFSLDIADNFRVIDLEEDDIRALLAESDLSEDAQLVIANTLSGPASGFLLWAFDFDAGNEAFIPNLNIVRLPRQPNETAAAIKETLARDYTGIAGADVVSIDDIDVDNRASLLVEALFPINGLDDDSTGFQLITFSDDYSYTITYSFINPSDAQRDLALDSLRTFAIT